MINPKHIVSFELLWEDDKWYVVYELSSGRIIKVEYPDRDKAKNQYYSFQIHHGKDFISL